MKLVYEMKFEFKIRIGIIIPSVVEKKHPPGLVIMSGQLCALKLLWILIQMIKIWKSLWPSMAQLHRDIMYPSVSIYHIYHIIYMLFYHKSCYVPINSTMPHLTLKAILHVICTSLTRVLGCPKVPAHLLNLLFYPSV